MKSLFRLSMRCSLVCLPWLASAAHAGALDGSRLHSMYALPFIFLLLCIALMPLSMPRFWHAHYGKVVAAWSLAFLLPFALDYGAGVAGELILHTFLAEYLPFITLLCALFAVSGGVYFSGNLRGTPNLNTGILALGAVLASFMGTTGAAMLLVRPLIRANDNRQHTAHVFIFFIFVVANIGGSMTPLGDPPLFLGFLKGVPFFWTVKHIWKDTLFMVMALLILFWLLDTWRFRREGTLPQDPTPEEAHALRVHGAAVNFPLLLGILGLVLMSGTWQGDVALTIAGTSMHWQNIVRDAGLLIIILLSLRLTPLHARQGNQFDWAPMQEVARLFAGIFVTMIPVLALLRAGLKGPFAPLVTTVNDTHGQPLPAMYFWATGMLSGFLDNAPTYLVFFNLAGGDVQTLTGPQASTLAAISAGAVFMGALSYIGNAPNLMVKSVVESRGLRMPGFFGYMLWSFGILLPLFAVVTALWMQ